MAYLKLIANPADDEAFRRAVAVPRRGIGDTTVEALGTAALAARRPLLAMAGEPDAIPGLRPAARKALATFHDVITRLRTLARDASVDEILRRLIDVIGYVEYLKAEGPESQERLENVRELLTGAAETVIDEGGEVGLTPLDHFLQRASLVAGVDALDKAADAVTLMTLHNAKGLEFPVVFLTGLEEGLFPLARSRDDPSALEEERRLFYVGITRAEDVLVLSHARGRRRNGEFMPSLPSSFLREVPRSLLVERATIRLRGSGRALDDSDGWGRSSTWLGESASPRQKPSERRPGLPVDRRPAYRPEDESQDLPAFRRGERVAHDRFGTGTIADVTGTGREAKVTVDFDDESIGRKRLVIAFAGLSRAVD
jgi:DNA helicase-2/ATP-dependent DNA helicase PcrA